MSTLPSCDHPVGILAFHSGANPRMSHHYRAHKMSVWLNLIPQLQKTGLGLGLLRSQSASAASVNSLVEGGGATWGVLRNGSNVQAAIDKDAEVRPAAVTHQSS